MYRLVDAVRVVFKCIISASADDWFSLGHLQSVFATMRLQRDRPRLMLAFVRCSHPFLRLSFLLFVRVVVVSFLGTLTSG